MLNLTRCWRASRTPTTPRWPTTGCSMTAYELASGSGPALVVPGLAWVTTRGSSVRGLTSQSGISGKVVPVAVDAHSYRRLSRGRFD